MPSNDPKYTPLSSSDDEYYAGVISVDGSDRNDTPADDETISSGEVIYTPSTASDNNSTQKAPYSDDDTMTEGVSLISQSPPPRYQSPNGVRPTNVDVKKDPEALGGPLDHDSNGCRRGCRTMWRKRGRCGRKSRREGRGRRRKCSCCCRALIILVKLALVISLFMWFFGGIIKKHCKDSFKHHGHHDGSKSHAFSRGREIVINETHNAIWGSYPLYDELSLSTTSGSIAVSVDPQPADPDDPLKPARLSLRSKSGSIAVKFKLPWSPFDDDDAEFDGGELEAQGDDADDTLVKRHKKLKDSYKRKAKSMKKCKGRSKQNRKCYLSRQTIAPRPYEVEIHTTQGSITGNIAFASSAHISSESGSITARVVPLVLPNPKYLDGKNVSLSTSVQSGSMYLHVAEPFFVKSNDEGDDFMPSQDKGECVIATASHVSEQSGTIVVAYPGSWAGRVHASTVGSGNIHLGGPGLKVKKDGQNSAEGVKDPEPQPEGKDWWGSSGRMAVSVQGEGSGSINFRVKKQHYH